jgi:hypothetical protein
VIYTLVDTLSLHDALPIFGNLFDNVCSFFLCTPVPGQLYIDVRTAEHPYGELRAVLNTKDGLRIR